MSFTSIYWKQNITEHSKGITYKRENHLKQKHKDYGKYSNDWNFWFISKWSEFSKKNQIKFPFPGWPSALFAEIRGFLGLGVCVNPCLCIYHANRGNKYHNLIISRMSSCSKTPNYRNWAKRNIVILWPGLLSRKCRT